MNAVGLEIVLHALGFALHVDENHDAPFAHFPDEADQQPHLVFVGRKEHGLANAVRCHLVRLDTYQLGLVHVFVSELHDALRERCRKQHVQSLVRIRKPAQQITDILDEAEIKHAVGFVENGNLDLVELEHALLEVVDDATGRANQQVDAVFQGPALFLVIRAAERDADLEPGVFAQYLRIVGDLYRKFARRREREEPRLTLRARLGGSIQESLIGRDQEGRRLAGAGLCLSGDVVALQGDRQRAGLYRRAELEARIADARPDALV